MAWNLEKLYARLYKRKRGIEALWVDGQIKKDERDVHISNIVHILRMGENFERYAISALRDANYLFKDKNGDN